jgi:phenylpropionate dioxygenase-like ring-hydroxylating dioxygenase large terminal subunit
MLQFWHPIIRSCDLRRKRPVGIRLNGCSIALFRPGPGEVAAVQDACPHRNMRLSLGKVSSGRLVCPYHGWSFDGDGRGQSPGTPKLHACTKRYDCSEKYGVIWVKEPGREMPVPEVDQIGYVPVGVTIHRIRAPMPLVMDNFSEVEHTVAMHPAFGFDPKRGHEATVTFEPSAEAVRVCNAGPAKAPHLLTQLLLWFRRRFLFHSDYTLRYDPPRAIVDHYWTDPGGGSGGMARYRLHHFFVPEDECTTRLVTFGAAYSRWPLPLPGRGVPLMAWYMLKAMAATIDEDKWLLENLADHTTDLEGTKLGRFDRVLGLNRDRLKRLYYDRHPDPVPAR